ncbi:MAG: CRISPR-associated endonuclease Cas2 [candidate division WOR-3 bacterium]
MFIAIAYDIKDDRRRNRVLNTLKNFGTWVQYSVFECNLKSEQLDRLRKILASHIKPSQDSIRFYYLCEECQRKVLVLGKGSVSEDEMVYII